MLNIVKIAIRSAEEKRWGAWLLRQIEDRLDAQFGRAPTVIAYAIERHQVVHRLLQSGHRQQLAQQLSVPVAITDGDTVGEKSRPIRSFLPEHVSRKGLFVRLRAHEDVGVHPLQFVDLRESGGMAERIGVITDA